MSAKPRVFVTRRIPAKGLDAILAQTDAEVWPGELPPPCETLRQKAADCVGLVSLLTDRIDDAFLAACPKLKVVSNYAVGFNNIDIPAATKRGVRVGNTPGVLTDATADMAFCLLIGAARRLVDGHDYGRANKWKTWEPLGHIGQDLAGRTLGIVGMGRIGTALARRCRFGWDMRVIYHDQHANAAAEKELGAVKVGLDELLSESDFVSVHTDLNETTK
ncbi:MAG: D-glycerate dehydrogenase, partial [Gemmataceae bacterium]|nr:D-glycerate dehydrogenase [Gemmataceae bacterium]